MSPGGKVPTIPLPTGMHLPGIRSGRVTRRSPGESISDEAGQNSSIGMRGSASDRSTCREKHRIFGTNVGFWGDVPRFRDERPIRTTASHQRVVQGPRAWVQRRLITGYLSIRLEIRGLPATPAHVVGTASDSSFEDTPRGAIVYGSPYPPWADPFQPRFDRGNSDMLRDRRPNTRSPYAPDGRPGYCDGGTGVSGTISSSPRWSSVTAERGGGETIRTLTD